MTEGNMKNVIPNDVKNDLVSKIQLVVEKFNYSNLKDIKDSEGYVKTGWQMFVDLKRAHNILIINGRKMIDNNSQEEKESLINKAMEEVEKEIEKPKDSNKNCRPYLKEVLGKIFQYTGAQVPNESIMEELITYCNQAAYDGCIQCNFFNDQFFIGGSSERVIYINCNNSNCIELKIDMKALLQLLNSSGKEVTQLYISSSLEFKLQSQGDEVKYTDGKLSLTLPKELAQDKNLLDRIIKWFKELFGIEIKGSVIEHSFDEQEKPRTEMEVGRVESLSVHQEER